MDNKQDRKAKRKAKVRLKKKILVCFMFSFFRMKAQESN